MEDEELGEDSALAQLQTQLSDLLDPATTEEAQGYARRFLHKQLNSPLADRQGELMSEMEKNAEEVRTALRAARERLAARRFNPSDRWYSLSKALGAPARVGGVGELASQAAEALHGSTERRRTFEETKEKDLLGYDQALAKLNQDLLMLKSGMITGQGKIDAELAKEALKTLGKRVSGRTSNEDRAQQAVDREYAKNYLDWVQEGAPEATKALNELGQARDRLRGYSEDSQTGERKPIPREDDFLTRWLGPTGRVSGTIATVPFVGKAAQDLLMPGAADIREIVEYTVQQSLRRILGSQFTKEEGERLIARVYNTRLRPDTNAARVDRLYNQILEAAKNKDRAARWFEEHGTMKGFQGKWQYDISDFEPEPINELMLQETTGSEPFNPDDYAPAVMPDGTPTELNEAGKAALEERLREQGAPTPAGAKAPRIGPDGRRIYKPSELPRRKQYAEGGAVADAEDTIWVEMPDGSLRKFPANATQEDVLAVSEPPSYDSSSERAVLAGIGAGAGYLGSRATLSAATKLSDLLPGRSETPAEARLLRLLERSNTRPSQLLSGVRKAHRLGVPSMVLDASPDLTTLAKTSMLQGGEEAQTILDRLNRRQEASRERALERVNKGLKPDDFFEKEEQLKTRLYGNKVKGIESEAAPLYRAAEQQFPAIRSRELMKLLETPSGKEAYKRARKTMKDKRKPIGKVNPVTKMVEKPSLEFLNQVKIELDNLIGKAQTSGELERARDLKKLRDAFRSELDTSTIDPETGESPYKTARGVHERNAQNLEILRLGREEFGRMQPQQVAKAVSEMDFEQRDAFRTGVSQKITEILNTPSQDINAAKRLIGSPAMREKLRLLFDSPHEFRLFEEALKREVEVFENSQSLLGREEAVRRKGAEPKEGMLTRGARKAPTLGVFSPQYWILKILREKPGISEKEANELLKMLKSQTPEELANFAKLEKKFGRKAARRRRAGKVGAAGAAIGSLVGLLSGGDDEEELEDLDEAGVRAAKTPAFAKGGKVGQLKALIKSLIDEGKLTAEDLQHHVFNLATKTDTDPGVVREAISEARLPVQPAGRPPVRIPAQPEQLRPYAKHMDDLKRQLETIRQSLAIRRMDPVYADQMSVGSNAAQLAYERMMSQPNPQNMQTLTELVRSLQQQAERRAIQRARGGRIRRQFGGMTNHG